MKVRQKLVSFVLGAGMELTWLYAWAAFLSEAILIQAFPLPSAIGTFLTAALSTRVSSLLPGRGKFRIVWVLLTKLFLFLACVLIMLHAFSDHLGPFFSFAWVIVFLHRLSGLPDWLVLGLICGMIIAFWISGSRLARRPLTQTSVSLRFDLGVTSLFVLYLIKLLLVSRGGMQIPDPYSGLLVFPFFIFSLLAFGMIVRQSHASGSFLSGFRGVGMMLSFLFVALGLGAAAVLLFLPHLTRAAEAVYTSLKPAAGPLGTMMVAIVQFLFAPGRMEQEPVRGNAGVDEVRIDHHPSQESWIVFLQQALEWLFMGVAVFVAVATAIVVLWWLTRCILRKFGCMQIPEGPSLSLREPLMKIWSRLRLLWHRLNGMLRGYASAAELFGAVMRWGSHSGISRLPAETPLEYSLRLGCAFPGLQREIAHIVESYHTEVYREMNLDRPHLRSAQTAWQVLRSPRQWPSRFKILFLGRHSHHA